MHSSYWTNLNEAYFKNIIMFKSPHYWLEIKIKIRLFGENKNVTATVRKIK